MSFLSIFTGTTRKRVVNLGDSRGGKSGRSFLERTKRERQERENTRERERHAIVLQLHLRRYFALSNSASVFYQTWRENTSGSDPDCWCAQASFIIRFAPRLLLETVYSSIFSVVERLGNSFSSRDVAVLVKAVNAGLCRGVSPHLALACLFRIFDVYPVSVQNKAVFHGMISNIMRFATPENMDGIFRLTFKINSADSPEAFIHFLASAPRGLFKHSLEYVETILNVFEYEQGLSALAGLSNEEKVPLLLNCMHLNTGPYTCHQSFVLATIISSMDFVIVPDNENEEPEDNTHPHKVVVSVEDYGMLLHLLSVNALKNTYMLYNLDEKLCARAISRLLYVFPKSRTSTGMLMLLTPDLPGWIFRLASKHPYFAAYISNESKAELLRETAFDARDGQELSFEELIYTYNQVLSSWLVISKDPESFQKESFPLDDIITYCRFLKSFCYSLIKNTDSGEVLRARELKELSISVLNQLYMKNLRLQFLPKLPWKIDGLELHPEEVVLTHENENHSSDEEKDELDPFNGNVKRVSALRMSSRKKFELEILNKVPFFVDFTTRVQILQNSIRADKVRTELDSQYHFFSDAFNLDKLSADIRREFVLDDAFESFSNLGQTFKNQLKVTFHNEHGLEVGIDGGGLTKEFLTSVVSEGFSPKTELALFKESSSYNLYPNDDIFWKCIYQIDLPTQRKRLMYTRFLGMIIGKCIYEGILVDVSFAPSFLSQWRVAQKNLRNSVDDLVFLDPELYSNLNKLFYMDEEQLRQLDLNFTINETIGNKTLLFDLLPPNGAQEIVDSGNRWSYIHKVSQFKLNHSLRAQTQHFLEGLFAIIEPNWFNMFDPLELQILISGSHDIDLEDWKSNVLYGGYFDDDETISMFWEVVEEMTSQERCDLVKFVTSVSRAPLLGFGVMYPKFGISNGGSPERLPTASTCLNLLKLPDYRNKALIRLKLLYSINANSGFDLS